MHDVMARRAQVLAQIMMQDRLYFSAAQEFDVVSIQVVGNEAEWRLALMFEGSQNCYVASTHRIHGIDMGVGAENVSNAYFRSRIKPMSTARVNESRSSSAPNFFATLWTSS